jgi:hypothetical protein
MCNETNFVHTRQEYLETTKLKKKVTHTQGNKYIVNGYSLHNYQHISAAIPLDLRASFVFVPNSDEIRRAASKQVRKKDSTPTDTILHGIEADREAPVPAFDRTAKKKQQTNKQMTSRTKKNAPVMSQPQCNEILPVQGSYQQFQLLPAPVAPSVPQPLLPVAHFPPTIMHFPSTLSQFPSVPQFPQPSYCSQLPSHHQYPPKSNNSAYYYSGPSGLSANK